MSLKTYLWQNHDYKEYPERFIISERIIVMGNLRIPSCNAFQVFHHTDIKGGVQDSIPSQLPLTSTQPEQLLDSHMSSPNPPKSRFEAGSELQIRFPDGLDSLKVPPEFFGKPISMIHSADPCSRFTAFGKAEKGQTLMSGAIPIDVEYQFTDVGDFRPQLKLGDDDFTRKVPDAHGWVDVVLENKPPTAASVNTSWHGPKPSSKNDSFLSLKHGPRGFETSYAIGQFSGTLWRACEASGRDIRLQTNWTLPVPVSVDIVTRLIVTDDAMSKYIADMPGSTAIMDPQQRFNDMVNTLVGE
jgi:hypothetical protein